MNKTNLILAMATLMLCGQAFADEARQYHIPAQSLNNALLKFSADSGVEILFTADQVRGLNANGLNGTLSTSQALSQLLQGSGVSYRFVDANTVTVEPAPNNLKKTAVVDEKPQSNNETGSDTTLPKVTVEADASYDPDWAKDPYNTDYVLPNATFGTKTDTPIMETPVNVQSISKQVFKDQQVISLDKALRNVSGVTTSGASPVNGSFRANTAQTFFLRGFQADTLFRNGFRMDGNAFGNGSQFANIESVEVLKGPASILYGRVEPGGMVNIVTKQPRATPYYSFNQQFGSYDLFRTSLDATGPLTKDDTLLYRVNASFQSNNSFRDLVHGEDIFLAPILKWNISPKTQATLEMEYNRQLSSTDSQFLPVVNNKIIDLPHSRNLGERNPFETENIFVGFNWSHQFNDDWSIKHQVAFKRQDVNQGLTVVPFNISGSEVSRFVVSGHSTNDTYATNLDLTGHFKTWGLEHTLLFGGDYYRFDRLNKNSTGHLLGFFVGPPFAPASTIDFNHPIHPGPNLDNIVDSGETITQNTDNYGLYLQDQIKLPYDIHVMGGLRYQYVHSTSESADTSPGAGGIFSPRPPQTDDAVTPRVGILWQPKKWLSLYSNYVENFGANLGAFSFVKGSNTLNPLPPQSAQQWEVGSKIELFDGRLRATLAYYDLKKQNLATLDVANRLEPLCQTADCSILVGEVRSRGPEIDIQGEILPGWNVIATYANQDVRITKSSEKSGTSTLSIIEGNRLQFVPRNVGSVWTTYEVQQGDLKGFKIGGGVNLQDGVVDTLNTTKSPGYALVGLMAGYSFEVGKSKITAQLNVDNLLDKTYFTNVFSSPVDGIAIGNFSTPRTFMGSINVEY